MNEPNLQAHIGAIKVTTKAARLRKLMPAIEAKLAEGVRAAEIVETLRKGGIELTMGTFRNYLHQFRTNQGKAVRQQSSAAAASPADSLTSNEPGESVSSETDSPETSTRHEPVSMLKFDRLMKRDPAEQAEKMAYYERLAKQNRRKR